MHVMVYLERGCVLLGAFASFLAAESFPLCFVTAMHFLLLVVTMRDATTFR